MKCYIIDAVGNLTEILAREVCLPLHSISELFHKATVFSAESMQRL